jgi:hypothetical protein
MLGLVMLPYRCTICDRREMKLRFIDMEPPSLSEQEETLIIPLPTERELEDAKKAEQRTTERAAKKAAERLKKEKAKLARKKAGEVPLPSVGTEEAVGSLSGVQPTPQLHTSDEEGEQIYPS